MRRAILTTLLVVLAGCGGSWSNKDIEFLKVIPNRAQLAAKLPQSASNAQPLTGTSTRRDGLNLGDPSQVAADTKKAVADFNKLLEFILAIPEAARKVPPTQRTADTRVWGPFAHPDNPGLEVRLTIKEIPVENPGDPQNYGWALEGRLNGGPYFPMILGSFAATRSLTEGQGGINVPVAAFPDSLRSTPELQQIEQVQILYDTDTSDGLPRRVMMVFTFRTGITSGISNIGYVSRERDDGSGELAFQVRTIDPNMLAVNVVSRWNADGAGRALGVVSEGAYKDFSRAECWDKDALITFASEGWPGGQTVGTLAGCVEVQGFD